MKDPTWILDELPAGVWVGQVPDGSVAYANRAFERIMGMAAVEAIDIDGAPGTYGIFDRQGNPYPVEKLPFSVVVASREPCVVDDIVIHRRDGKKVNIRGFGYPVFDAGKDMTHVVVAFFDISKEVTAEIERKQTEANLALVMTHAPVALWSTDSEGVILFCKGGRETSLQLVGKNIFEVYKDHPTIPSVIRQCLNGETLQHTAPVGDAICDTWLTPVRDAGGQIVGVTALSQDVTEIRRLQGAAIQNDRVIALGTLAASVAHEINNPLTYMLAHAQHLQEATERLAALADELSGPQRERLMAVAQSMRDTVEPMCTGTERIAAITRDLRTFSRSDADDSMGVDLRGATQSVLQLVRKELEGRAALHLDLQDTAAIRGNQARLVQVIMNLVVNAMQALPESDPTVNRIVIRTRNDGDQVMVEVEDSGAGVPAELRERIFDPFMSTKEIGKGTGLGLFVSRNIVREFGGEITVGGTQGGGAVFRVSFPRATLTESRRPDGERNTALSHPPVEARILVIDDEIRVASVLCASLRSAGYHAEHEQDSKRALERLIQKREVFDLIFCDLMMRGMTGMDLAREMQEKDRAVLARIVFMTGGAFTPQAQKFLQANAQQCVEKPFDIITETERRLRARST